MAIEASLSFWFEVKYSRIKRICTKKWIFFDEGPIFFVVLGDHWRNHVSKGLSIDKPKERWF
jgi:hypothetical protein